ncbi:MAG: hypothetical protein WCT77_00590, partial [Bacteroidota bacterium]
RNFPSQIVYSPIILLSNYKKLLLDSGALNLEQIDKHILDIKKQRIIQLFYLPKYDDYLEESIVFFDRVNHVDNKYISRNDIRKLRIFTLSNYGHYLLLFKFSMHFTRFNDQVDRKSLNQPND